MRTVLAWLVVSAQVAVLAWMAGEREWILRHGATMVLRTAPVDPRDPMRGDYLRFGYEVSRIPAELCRDAVKTWLATQDSGRRSVRDRVVYVRMRLDEEGIAAVESASDRQPDTGPYLRGRVVMTSAAELTVRFGVEALFVEQGRGRAFEEEARRHAGAPLDVVIAVGRGGTAVLKSYRWEPLGITVTPDRSQRPAGVRRERFDEREGLRGITVTLKNHGSTPLAIVVPAGQPAFRLIANQTWAANPYVWVGVAERPKPAADMVKVLAPGGTFSQHLDLTVPAWFVRDTRHPEAPPRAVGELPERAGWWFRIEYVAPPRADCTALPHAEVISHQAVRSSPFSAQVFD